MSLQLTNTTGKCSVGALSGIEPPRRWFSTRAFQNRINLDGPIKSPFSPPLGGDQWEGKDNICYLCPRSVPPSRRREHQAWPAPGPGSGNHGHLWVLGAGFSGFQPYVVIPEVPRRFACRIALLPTPLKGSPTNTFRSRRMKKAVPPASRRFLQGDALNPRVSKKRAGGKILFSWRFEQSVQGCLLQPDKIIPRHPGGTAGCSLLNHFPRAAPRHGYSRVT